MEASAQPWVLRALGPNRKSLCFLDGFKISCPYPYFICYSWKTRTLFICSLSSQGKLQDGSQEEGNYGLQIINEHLPGLQRLRRWRVSQGHSFTSSINNSAWSLTRVFSIFMQFIGEKRDLPVCGTGDNKEAAGEKRKMKGYTLGQAGLVFLPSWKVWRDNTQRTASTALLWKHAFPNCSALLKVLLQESQRWACTPCKLQV